jgi:hypothetical protein
MDASSSDWNVADGPGSTNCGIRLVKSTAIFGFSRFVNRP